MILYLMEFGEHLFTNKDILSKAGTPADTSAPMSLVLVTAAKRWKQLRYP